MFWRDMRDDGPGAAWLGLEGVVPAASRARAHLHVQAGAQTFLRLVAGSMPLLWARIAPDHYGYWYLRPDHSPHPADLVLPPWAATASRAIDASVGSDAWYAAWARLFLQHLAESPRSPLHPGGWVMAPCFAAERAAAGAREIGTPWPRAPSAFHLEHALSQRPHDYTDWDRGAAAPLALRPASPSDDGRVKAWRRGLREGHIPPVLLLWITGLCRYLILDGHDRLHAALLEGQAPPMLALFSVRAYASKRDASRQAIAEEAAARLSAARAGPPAGGHPPSMDTANRLLVAAYDDRPLLAFRTLAWPLDGGVGSWLEEVRDALRRMPSATRIESRMVAAPDVG